MNKLISTEHNFEKYKEVFLKENSRLNLISKNDEKYLYEKHIYDSLGIKLFFEQYGIMPKTLLDIGTGGGFPSIPIAIEYPHIYVTGVDSIQKKINAVNNIVSELELKNIKFIRERIENINDKQFDIITSRAVGKLELLIKYAYPLLKDNGFMVFYKSKTAEEELDEAKDTIRKFHLKIRPVITYKLPMEEQFERCLIVLQK